MIVALLLLSFLFDLTNCELTMMIVYGAPVGFKKWSTFNLTWEECVEQCYESQACSQVAFQNSTLCQNFLFSRWGSIEKLDAESGIVVAIKVDAPSDQCPVGENPPTFDNKNATGALYIDDDPNYFPRWIYYTIYFTGDSWELTYKTNSSCIDFIDISMHSDGTASCYTGTYAGDSKGFGYQYSVDICKNDSAVLAAINYPENFEHYYDVIEATQPDLATPDTYARVDGKRTAACQATPKTAECMSVKGFDFDGTPPANFDNITWVTDSSAQDTPDSNCLVIVGQGARPFKMDVQGCTSTSPLKANIALCTRPAWTFDLY